MSDAFSEYAAALLDDIERIPVARDAAQVQTLLYRLHAAIAGQFGKAELTVAPASESERDYLTPFGWFG